MQARVVVFPIRGRAWCFARPRPVLPATSASASAAGSGALPPPPTLKDLWLGISAGGRTAPENAEAVADFVADKMNRAWIGFGSAPEGSVKRRIHSFGLKLLSRVRPSETLLKSLTKDVSMLEIVHPASINPRLVRRRLRHIAVRGAAIHKKYLYGSICMLPVTSVFMVLPLPNIPFFWTLFRAYSHWRALQGSERLHLLVSDCSGEGKTLPEKKNGMSTRKDDDSQYAPWNFQPSQKLDGFLKRRGLDEGLDCDTISRICQTYDLDKVDVLKYRDLEWPSSASRTT
ncbi:hypothetical protein CFC21_087392 [Triticum aestivum]|uniref:Uncharacterized protein n=3 Tax=Triticum TaxID=4564 RepID=A0A9R1B8L6_TRITD|nr:uncharacterized protein LOC123136336 [Triticum aestivum]KAF7083624.1 hypothetical protein CFC21_087392 [Triticum aestivum]VAI55475.1 unnamed protein product [Triticum turgidum subsp. durum]